MNALLCFAGGDEKALGKGPSSVRLQWDPDHHPDGSPRRRRAIQLGLRNDVCPNIYSVYIHIQNNISHIYIYQYMYFNLLDIAEVW